MEYQVRSQKLQDAIDKTVRLTAKAGDLGAVTATTLTIPLADLAIDPIEASDVLVAKNLTDATTMSPSIVGSNLVLGDAALAASDIVDIVIKLK